MVTFIAIDDSENSTTGTVEVTVLDTTPPELSVVLKRSVLWPPNHKLSGIEATVTVTDIADPAPTFVMTSVTSNEPDYGKGDGDTINDIQGVQPGSADTEFQLRSERSGRGNERKYTIVYTATDASGNTSETTVCVIVPHDQSGMALASSGFTSDGRGLNPDVERFTLVVLGRPAGDLDDSIRNIDPKRAFVGNHLAAIASVADSRSHGDGDAAPDLVLTYPADVVRELLANLDADDTVALRYERRDGLGYLIEDIFALGPPVATVPDRRTGDELVGKAEQDASQSASIPARTVLVGATPNPFNATATILYDLATLSTVEIHVYGPSGAHVRTLLRSRMPAGRHRVVWDGRDSTGKVVASGVYI